MKVKTRLIAGVAVLVAALSIGVALVTHARGVDEADDAASVVSTAL